MSTTTSNPSGRPRPILDAIRGGAWKTVLGTLVTAAVSFGVLNAEQATVVHNIVAAVATIVTAVTAILTQLHILGRAEPKVTPLADPRNSAGQRLTVEEAKPPRA
jgi:hypothetical protein